MRGTAITGNMFGVLAIVIWAAGFPAADVLLHKFDPLTLITVRMVLGSAFLLPLWWVADGRKMLNVPWLWALSFGGITFGFGAFLLLYAQDLTDAVTVAIISAAAPLFASIVEVFTGTRRIRPALLAGLIAAILGGIVAIGGNLSLDLGLGAIAVVVSSLLYVTGSHMCVHAMPNVSPIGRGTLPLLGASIVLLIMWLGSFAMGWVERPSFDLTAYEFNMLAVYSIGSLAISQLFFIAAVGKIGVTLTSFHINVAPFYVMLLLVAMGGVWGWPQAIGAAIVVAGALIVQLRP